MAVCTLGQYRPVEIGAPDSDGNARFVLNGMRFGTHLSIFTVPETQLKPLKLLYLKKEKTLEKIERVVV